MAKQRSVRIVMISHQEDDDPEGPPPYRDGPIWPASDYQGHELRLIVPLADTTIYEMEKRGEFPRRFNLTPRCVVWDLEEVETWLEQRRQTYLAGAQK